jgi:hypothetical protein
MKMPSIAEQAKDDKVKIDFILKTVCIKGNSKGIPYSAKQSFQKIERNMGHDLFVKAIMGNSKAV